MAAQIIVLHYHDAAGRHHIEGFPCTATDEDGDPGACASACNDWIVEHLGANDTIVSITLGTQH